jgi:hypothetical protein
LLTTDRHRLALDVPREDELIAAFQSLAPQTQTVALPIDDLDLYQAIRNPGQGEYEALTNSG